MPGWTSGARNGSVPGRRLAYDRPRGAADDVVGLLLRGRRRGRGDRMTCPTSLRDVDQGIRLLLDREDGTARDRPASRRSSRSQVPPDDGAAAGGDGSGG